MRPGKLTMEAFGSYNHETLVDFERLGSGVFLITGDTGAGKTTIFDAMVFALFGTPSGTERKPEMMLSDFSGREHPTKVTLTFTHGGRAYRVERTMRVKKERKTGQYTGNVDKNALLTGDSLAGPVEKWEAVTHRIEEILGMDGSQFRKIVMLAQGEFRAFLSADSKERESILSLLFDDRRYRLFQDGLRQASSSLEEARKADRDRIGDAVAELEEEEHPDSASPDLIPWLEQKFGEKQKAVDGLREKKTETEKMRDALLQALERRKKAEDTAAMLSGAEAQQTRLQGQRDEMEGVREKLGAGEKARQVIPAEDALMHARKQTEDARRTLENTRTELKAHTENLRKLEQTDKELHEKTEPLLESFRFRERALKESLPGYERREALRKELKEREEARDAAEKQLEKTENDFSRNRGAREKVRSRLKELESCAVQLSEVRHALENTQRCLRDMKKAEKDRVDVLNAEQKAGDALGVEEEARKASEAAGRKHLALVQLRIQGQAAELGHVLKTELEEQGAALCPVCGTRFDRLHRPAAAPSDVYVPGREEVEAAAESSREATEKLNQAVAAAENARSVFGEKREQLLNTLQAMGVEMDWDQLRESKEIRERVHSLEKETGELAGREETLLGLCEEQEALQKQQEKLETDGKRLEENRDKEQNQLRELREAIPEVKAKIAAFVLEFATSEEAGWALDEVRGKIGEHEKALSASEETLRKARDRKVETEGRVQAGEKQLENSSAEESRRLSAFGEALSRQEMTGEAYSAVRREMGEDPAAYVKGLRDTLQAWERDLEALAERIRTLKAQMPESMEGPAAAQLADRLDTVSRELNGLGESLENALGRSRHASEILRRVREASGRLAETDRASRMLQELAQCDQNRAGHIAFNRFVLSYTFREILLQANSHLDRMTGGRYRLVHRMTEKDGRVVGGLGMDILDEVTGEKRNTSSLSGGESFEVSLSLALGLSDIISSRSGMRQAEAMFIDEGFGSLGEKELSAAMDVLSSLAGQSRQIGIISHVSRLEECIPTQIRVTGSREGSRVEIRS